MQVVWLGSECLHLLPSLISPHYDILVQRCHCILLLSLTTLLLPTTVTVSLSIRPELSKLPGADYTCGTPFTCPRLCSHCYPPLSPPNFTGSGRHRRASSSNSSASAQLLPNTRVSTITGSNVVGTTSQAPPRLSVKALGRARELVPPCALFIYQET